MVTPGYLTPPEGERVEAFFRHWFGAPRHDRAPVDDTRPDVPLPTELWRHHELLARWGVSRNRNYRLLHPTDIGFSEVEPPEIVVFLEEEQGVDEWGFDADERVWRRDAEDGAAWEPLGADVGRFLLAYELVEAAFGWGSDPSASCAWMRREDAESVVAPLGRLPVPAWPIGAAPHHLFGNDDALALVGPNPFGQETPETATGWEIWVSGRRPGALAWLADVEAVVGTEGWRDREQLERYDGIVWDTLRLL